MLVYLNGDFLPKSDAKISVEDRGFIFGDGVYEVWHVVHGTLFEHDRHMARLHRGLGELRITRPAEASRDGILQLAQRLIDANDVGDGEAMLYLEITRGVAPRVHQFPEGPVQPTVYAFVKALASPTELHATGATVITVPDIRWHRCDIKTIQLLPNVLAKQQAAERGALEAVFVRDGVVTECSHSNIMAVLDGELRTHPLNSLILGGITRDVVLEMARADGIPVREEAIRAEDIARVSELFMTATTTDVTSVVRVDDRQVGTGAPGPIATRLAQLLAARIVAQTSRVSTSVGR